MAGFRESVKTGGIHKRLCCKAKPTQFVEVSYSLDIRPLTDTTSKATAQPFEVTLNLAAEVVRRLPKLDKLAKRVAVADLLEDYNNGWNEYEEAQEDGSMKSVSNPQLSEAEFEAKLSLRDVNVTGNQMIEFFYDNERMFWGHSVIVSSLNGTDFSDAYAEIFG